MAEKPPHFPPSPSFRVPLLRSGSRSSHLSGGLGSRPLRLDSGIPETDDDDEAKGLLSGASAASYGGQDSGSLERDASFAIGPRRGSISANILRQETRGSLEAGVNWKMSAEGTRSEMMFPSAASCVLMQIGLSFGYCLYCLSAWLYVTMHRGIFLPVGCSWGSAHTVKVLACDVSMLLFWTFPIVCCIMLHAYMYRDLLQSRLYYECFSHRVYLDFTNVSFLSIRPVQFMLVWLVLSLSIYPAAGLMSLGGVIATVPYWIPICSLGLVMYQTFDIESRLVSVAKFVKTDLEWAVEHMESSFYMKDYVARHAWRKLQREQLTEGTPTTNRELLDKGTSIGGLIHLVASEAEDLDEDELEHFQEEYFPVLSAMLPSYWIKEMLFNPHCTDKETNRFYWWFALYLLYMVLSLFLLFYLLIATFVTQLHTGAVGADFPDWFSHIFGLEFLTLVPIPHAEVSKAVTESELALFRSMRRFL